MSNPKKDSTPVTELKHVAGGATSRPFQSGPENPEENPYYRLPLPDRNSVITGGAGVSNEDLSGTSAGATAPGAVYGSAGPALPDKPRLDIDNPDVPVQASNADSI